MRGVTRIYDVVLSLMIGKSPDKRVFQSDASYMGRYRAEFRPLIATCARMAHIKIFSRKNG